MGETKPNKSMETKLKRIAELSRENSQKEFKWLMPHFNEESLKECFKQLDGQKAVGENGITKREYGISLDANIKSLVGKMKTMSYKPGPVREVQIPKHDGKSGTRPLGISNLEDKIVQMMASKVLTSIYDPIFYDFSYGFRPGKSCHDAVRALSDYLHKNWVEVVIDVDLKNFFGSINHDLILKCLRRKICDEKFLRYIVRMLKSGVLKADGLYVTEEGTPQGSIVSPILANIVAHYVIDEWFEKIVKKHTRRAVSMVRYADDLVICCQYTSDAYRIRQALQRRLTKFGLQLNEDKTKLVKFSKQAASQGRKQETFDFLGFTIYVGKTRQGKCCIKVKTSRKRMKSKLVKVKEWMKKYRHKGTLKELWDIFRIKLKGHIQYYGVSFNIHYVQRFVIRAQYIFFKWVNRRGGRGKSINWGNFMKFINQYPPPKAVVCHSLIQ